MATDLHLIIANKAYSSWSLRPWLAMKVKKLPFKEAVIPLGQDDTQARIKEFSPTGKVPALHHGGIAVWDSLAILDYLADQFFDRHWWPSDPHARAVARSISAEMHSGFTHLRQNLVMNVRKTFPASPRTPDVDADIARIKAIWNECRAKFGAGGPFLFGEFSNADAMYAPVVTRFKTYSVDLDPVCAAYSEAVLNMPEMREWYISAAGEPWIIAKYEK